MARSLHVDVPLILTLWGIACLGGSASPTSYGPAHGTVVPAWLAITVTVALNAGAAVTSAAQTIRRGRGVDGPSRQVMTMYMWAWPLAFGGLIALNVGLFTQGAPLRLAPLLWPAYPHHGRRDPVPGHRVPVPRSYDLPARGMDADCGGGQRVCRGTGELRGTFAGGRRRLPGGLGAKGLAWEAARLAPEEAAHLAWKAAHLEPETVACVSAAARLPENADAGLPEPDPVIDAQPRLRLTVSPGDIARWRQKRHFRACRS